MPLNHLINVATIKDIKHDVKENRQTKNIMIPNRREEKILKIIFFFDFVNLCEIHTSEHNSCRLLYLYFIFILYVSLITGITCVVAI